MSKQYEAEIGVETILTVYYSKNDSRINMKRRKVLSEHVTRTLSPHEAGDTTLLLVIIRLVAEAADRVT